MRIQRRALAGVAAVGVLSVLMVVPAYAGAEDDVTYYEHVLPILQQNCQSCHRSAGQNITGIIAPMSLMTYEETRPWARAVAQKVETREMPPWYASEETAGLFSNERALTDEEITTIVTWVNAGAPAGDKAAAPAPLVFGDEGNGWFLGTPDFVVKMEEYLIPDESYDVQTTFRTKIPAEFLPDGGVWVRGWEFRAGDSGDRVHHYCAGVEEEGTRVDADAGQGEEDEGAAAARGGSLGCVSAGTEAKMLPEGWGMFIETGSSARYSMHYNKQPGPGTAFTNQAELGFYLSKEPVKYVFENQAIGNRGYMIPAHRDKYRVGAGRMLEKDTYVVNYWPHAHFRGVGARYTATYPDGTQELLLDVPKWDQGWQETYWYNEPKLLPKGTMIDVSFWYNNTSENGLRKGFDADRSLGHGPRTNDEMALGFFAFAEEIEPETGSQD
jgi:mono/diheme cytochrome c family protein